MSAMVISRTILFGECDPAGIVYTPRFTDFALEATHQTLTKIFGKPSIRVLNDSGLVTPVRHSEVNYLQPLRYDDVLLQDVSVSHIGQHSYTFAINGSVNGSLVFKATISYVVLCQQHLTKVELPDWFRDVLQKLVPTS